ncbi:MAG: virulence factor [Terriglobia bacterium]
MAQYQILYWREIPAQIKVFEGRKAISRPLPESFQQAIDRVAMAEGLVGEEAYLNEWHWSAKMERPGTSSEVLEAILKEIETEFGPRISG